MSIIDSSAVNSIDFSTLQSFTPTNPPIASMISIDNTSYENGITNLGPVLNIPITQFNAIKGNTLVNYVQNPSNVSIRAQSILASDYRDSTFDVTTLNSIGCYLSHVTLWNQVISNKLKGMYIFESDAKCFGSLDITQFLNTDGDILLFGCTLPGNSFFSGVDVGRTVGLSKVNQHFYGLHSYYITFKGALKALKTAFPIVSQVDAYLSDLSIIGGINIYSYYPSICIQNVHESSLQTKLIIHERDAIILFIGIIMLFLVIIGVLWFVVRKV